MASEGERAELLHLLGDPANEAIVQSRIAGLLEADKDPVDVPEETMQSMLTAIFAASTPVSEKRPFRLANAGWWAAAAAILVLVWVLAFQREVRPPMAVTEQSSIPYVAPAGNKAVLTLSNGEAVLLDSAGQRRFAQGSASVVQQGGLIRYDANGEPEDGGFNQLSTPRGGQFRVILPDGTIVWLNTASSLKYPVAFGNGERRVEVMGEAYFEVTKDSRRPFIVKVAGGGEVAVLGTRFNVSAYADEGRQETTLLEGAVEIRNGSRSLRLAPGQQGSTRTGDNGISLVAGVNIGQVMAWKNGYFDFNKMPLDAVMRQLSRWYDLEVVYARQVPDIVFWGRMERNLPLPDVLKILEESDVHFKVEQNGKRLIVEP